MGIVSSAKSAVSKAVSTVKSYVAPKPAPAPAPAPAPTPKPAPAFIGKPAPAFMGKPTPSSPSGTYITPQGGVSHQAPAGTASGTFGSGGGSSGGSSGGSVGTVTKTPTGGVSTATTTQPTNFAVNVVKPAEQSKFSAIQQAKNVYAGIREYGVSDYTSIQLENWRKRNEAKAQAKVEQEGIGYGKRTETTVVPLAYKGTYVPDKKTSTITYFKPYTDEELKAMATKNAGTPSQQGAIQEIAKRENQKNYDNYVGARTNNLIDQSKNNIEDIDRAIQQQINIGAITYEQGLKMHDDTIKSETEKFKSNVENINKEYFSGQGRTDLEGVKQLTGKLADKAMYKQLGKTALVTATAVLAPPVAGIIGGAGLATATSAVIGGYFAYEGGKYALSKRSFEDVTKGEWANLGVGIIAGVGAGSALSPKGAKFSTNEKLMVEKAFREAKYSENIIQKITDPLKLQDFINKIEDPSIKMKLQNVLENSKGEFTYKIKETKMEANNNINKAVLDELVPNFKNEGFKSSYVEVLDKSGKIIDRVPIQEPFAVVKASGKQVSLFESSRENIPQYQTQFGKDGVSGISQVGTTSLVEPRFKPMFNLGIEKVNVPQATLKEGTKIRNIESGELSMLRPKSNVLADKEYSLFGVSAGEKGITLGYFSEGKVRAGSPKLLEFTNIGSEIRPEGALGTSALKKELGGSILFSPERNVEVIDKNTGLFFDKGFKEQKTPRATKEAIEIGQSLIRETEGVKSNFISKEPLQTERLTAQETSALIDFGMKKEMVVKGSLSGRTKTPEIIEPSILTSKDKINVIEETKVDFIPHDIDLKVKFLDKRLLEEYKTEAIATAEKAGKGKFRKSPDVPEAIEKLVNGKWEKVLEFKGESGSMNLMAGEQVGTSVLGFTKSEKPVKQGDVMFTTLAEELRGTVQGVYRVKKQLTETEKPILDIFPSEKREKDIAKVQYYSRQLLESKQGDKNKLGESILAFEELFGKKELKPANLNKPSEFGFDFSPSTKVAKTSRGVSSSILVSPKPSPALFSPSVKTSPSTSIFSPSIKTSPSTSIFSPLQKSPSQSPRISPSPSPSPSIFSPSSYTSPSPQISPSPSLFGGLGGLGKVEVGGGQRGGATGRLFGGKLAYTPSLGSILIKEKAVKVTKEQAERLTRKSYTGLELRPQLEIVDNKKKKKRFSLF